MRAFTTHQPWASLIAEGAKEYETRSWGTNYRGPVAIHAGKREPRIAELPGGISWKWTRDQPLGAIVAIATLTDCVHTNWLDVSSEERAVGDWSPWRYAWKLEDVKALPEPIPCRGYQGLWHVPHELVGRLRSHAARPLPEPIHARRHIRRGPTAPCGTRLVGH